MYKIYGDIYSGNCYKIKLLMSLLDIEHEWLHIDILAGETQTMDFKARNPVGKIPTLELEDGTYLFESNAILNYLATDTAYLPPEPLAHARVLQWQFFEQYSHEPGIAVARFIAKYLGMPTARQGDFEAAQKRGYQALAVMQDHLETTDYFVGHHYSIADISLYAYTHVAGDGGFELRQFPAIEAWLERIAAHPRHVTMEQFGARQNH